MLLSSGILLIICSWTLCIIQDVLLILHVVFFSADQYGSRFIQQKLETATTEEKTMVYQEIIPQVLTLMTDVFGNYVVQKVTYLDIRVFF